MKYKIKNWPDYQHYKDRCPPWIKLHHSLLTSELWVMGNDATRTLAIASMLLASRNELSDGTFNGDPEYIKRFAYLNSKPDFKPLIEYGFIETVQDASNMLAICNTEKRREEKNREETDKKVKKTSVPKDFKISEQVIEWANKNGYSKLEERLSHFVMSCEAKGYQYANWDSAFRKAIADDWAKLGKIEPPKPFNIDDFLKAKNG